MIKLNVGGLEATLFALRKSSVTVQQAAGPAVESAGRAYASAVRKRISLRDHTLADLARLDHPYAKRHGQIRIHRKLPWQVHRQSGKMLSAFRHRPIITSGSPGYEVTFDYLAAPHARDVIQGTRVMLPRDVLWRTAHERKTREEMMKAIIRTLGKEMRTQLGVRFGPTSPGGSIGPGGGNLSVR